MVWLLVALALFNVISMITVFAPRAVPRRTIPWALFGTALLATELAWMWLPLQCLLVWLLVWWGALDSGQGNVAMAILSISWLGLLWSVWMSTKAQAAVEDALVAGLGRDYREQIPARARERLREQVRFSDWYLPFKMRRPDVEVLKHIPYAPGGVRQQLDIYRPRQIPAEGCPVLLQIHGGGWMMGDKGGQALPLMYEMASRGWICVAANYRLSPSVAFPTHLQDCKSALCWIRTHGREYGMNPDFVAVTGGSAGGHLTAMMGLTANRPDFQPDHAGIDTSVQAFVPFYGVYDFLMRYGFSPYGSMYERFLTGKVFHESLQDNPDLWDMASPVTYITEHAPPCMVFHGTLDSLALVSEGRTFSARLREKSRAAVVYVEMPGAEHAWETVHSLRTEHTIDGVHRFLEWVRASDSSPLPGSPAVPKSLMQ